MDVKPSLLAASHVGAWWHVGGVAMFVLTFVVALICVMLATDDYVSPSASFGAAMAAVGVTAGGLALSLWLLRGGAWH